MAGFCSLSTPCQKNFHFPLTDPGGEPIRNQGLTQKGNPQPYGWGFGDKAPGDDLLLHGLSHTTIGACAFHFRVRDGIGWFHAAIITRERVEGRWLPSKKEVALTLSLGLGT